MRKMNNLEYSYLVKELSGGLAGKHFNRIRKISEGKYRMKIGTAEILSECGTRINLTRYIEESESGSSDKFVDKLNKELDNARLRSISQVNNDRILSFEFDSGPGPTTLVFEMFGEGNIILVRNGKAVCAMRYESWSDREIKAGSDYRPPKTAPSDTLEATGKYIIVSLMKLPLGKEYALEALSMCGIDEKTPGTSLSGNKLMELENAISALKAGARPYGFFRDGKMEDFALARLSRYNSLEAREFPTLSEAADEFYAHAMKEDPLLEKLSERLAKQKERLAALAAEEKVLREKGDFVYSHYQQAEEIIVLAKAGEYGELESRFGAKMDKKERSVEVELQ